MTPRCITGTSESLFYSSLKVQREVAAGLGSTDQGSVVSGQQGRRLLVRLRRHDPADKLIKLYWPDKTQCFNFVAFFVTSVRAVRGAPVRKCFTLVVLGPDLDIIMRES